MDASEAAVLGFTAAMIAVSLVLIAVRSARRPKSAAKMPAASARIQERVFEPIEEPPDEEPTAEPVPAETWTILKNDQEIGPVKFDELEVYARQGLVKDSELLKASNSKRWVRARDIPGLSFASASPAVAASGSSAAPARTRSAAPDLTIPSLNIPNLDIAMSPRERPAGPVAQPASAPAAPRRTARRRDLRDPIRPAPPRVAEPTASEAAEPRKRGYLVRSWRGDLRLAVSFWVNGLLVGTLAAAFASAAWDMPDLAAPLGPQLAPAAPVALWTVAGLLVLWHVVGVWRSASNDREQNPGRSWGRLAKAAIVLTLVAPAAGLGLMSAAPQLTGFLQALRSDTTPAPYALRLERDGREIELTGPISAGAAKAFGQMLDANPTLKLVHLGSPGGGSPEAREIARLIQAHNLATHVIDDCIGACTLVFLSGVDRLIGPSGRLGFRSPDAAGLSADELGAWQAQEKQRLDEIGASADFTRQAATGDKDEAWFPPVADLLAAHVVTRVVNPFEFALSGFEPADLSEQSVQGELLSDPAYAKIREIDSAQFDKLVQTFTNGLKAGVRGVDLIHLAREPLNAVYSEALPYASDEDVVQSLRITVETTAKIRAADSPDCYYYLHESQGGPDVINAIETKYPAEIGAEWELKRKVIIGYNGKNARVLDAFTATTIQNRIWASVHDKFGEDANVLFGASIPADKHLLHCSVAVAYYGAILDMAASDSASFFRYLLTSQ